MMSEFPKYLKIKHLGDDETKGIFEGNIIVEEKYDGSNFRIKLEDGKWIFGSRNTTLGNEDDNIGGQFEQAVKYVISKIPKGVVEQIYKTYGELVFYGENMVPHTIKDYDWEHMPQIIWFDIFSLKEGRFLDYDRKSEIFKMMGVEMPQLIYRGDGNKYEVEIPQSKWRNGKAEGVVIKNYELGIFGKVVDEKFKEENGKTFGSVKYGLPISDKYATSARIEKTIMKLRDEGHPIEMRMMQFLPKYVYEDIVEEHYRDILMSNWVVNFKKERKAIATKCVEILKRMCVNEEVKQIRSNTTEDN